MYFGIDRLHLRKHISCLPRSCRPLQAQKLMSEKMEIYLRANLVLHDRDPHRGQSSDDRTAGWVFTAVICSS
jgi:hypothetical protein